MPGFDWSNTTDTLSQVTRVWRGQRSQQQRHAHGQEAEPGRDHGETEGGGQALLLLPGAGGSERGGQGAGAGGGQSPASFLPCGGQEAELGGAGG